VTFLILLLLLSFAQNLSARQQFPWPVTPFTQSHEITGNFAEFRNTGSSDHFHNGTDIPKPDGSPVYPVKDGIVTSISSAGSNAFVRVQDVAYVHIFPNPSLSIGDSVFASETVLGTILSGLGHVHFTNGFVGSEKNSMLMNSGLTPLNDPWPPIIRFIEFYQNNSNNKFSTNVLSGLVDIRVKVDEQNGAPTSRISRRNNGTYKIGYKILSADRSTVVFEPPNKGIRFQFNTKPGNSNVHRVYSTNSTLTNHIYIVTNDITRDNFWNTAAIPEGHYVVMAFTEDTRMNTDTMYVDVETTDADFTPPVQPVLRYTNETETGGFTIGWFPNTDTDLLGYRIYFSRDNETWTKWRGEEVLKASSQDTILNSKLNTAVYFRMTAVDNAPFPNESIPSDTYGLSNGDFLGKTLIVDGFDRTDGSWTASNQAFAFDYGQAILANDFSFDTVPNESVTDSTVDLNDYRAVFWFLGDESEVDETFSVDEQHLLENYLANGGNLFVSGTNIAWDLDSDSGSHSTAAGDDLFLHQVLQADYSGKIQAPENIAGAPGAVFEGLGFSFDASAYQPDSFDVLTTVAGAQVLLRDNASNALGLQFSGFVKGGQKTANVIYMTVPFEIIGNSEIRQEMMGRILTYFSPVTAVADRGQESGIPEDYNLLSNYPNPFNPATTITYELPVPSYVEIDIFNARGQKIRTLLAASVTAGKHDMQWNGVNDAGQIVSSGVYMVRVKAVSFDGSGRGFEKVKKMLFLK